jgi:hypothetical protein
VPNTPGGLNRTGAGFHRDTRVENREARGQSRRRAIQMDLRDLVFDEADQDETDQA